jgi:hypothetical protein
MKKMVGALLIVFSFLGCQSHNSDSISTANRMTNRSHGGSRLLLYASWEKLTGDVDQSSGVLLRRKTTARRLCSQVIKSGDGITIRVTPKAGYQWKHFTAKSFDGTSYKGAQKHGVYASSPRTITISPDSYYMFGVKPTNHSAGDWATLDVNTSFLTIELVPSWKLEQGLISKGNLWWRSSRNRIRSGVYRIDSDVLRVFPRVGYEWKYWVADYDEASGEYVNAVAGIVYGNKPRSIRIDRSKFYMFGVRREDDGVMTGTVSSYLTFGEDKWRKEVILRAKQLLHMTYRSSGYVPVAGANDHVLSSGSYNYVKNDVDLGPRHYGMLKPNTQYSGGPYSSVTWMNHIIGTDISFETFMTSLRNPNSPIHKVDLRNGTNRGGYYGTVCSGLVLYVLGLDTSMTSNQMIESALFDTLGEGEFLQYQMKAEDVEIGDILVYDGHVQVISNVVRGEDGKVEQVIVTESVKPFVRETIYTVDGSQSADT